MSASLCTMMKLPEIGERFEEWKDRFIGQRRQQFDSRSQHHLGSGIGRRMLYYSLDMPSLDYMKTWVSGLDPYTRGIPLACIGQDVHHASVVRLRSPEYINER